VTHLRACRIDEARPLLDLAAQIAGEHDLDAAKYRIDAQRAYCLLVRGEWNRAEQMLRAQLTSPGDPGVNAVNPLAFLGRILARRGDPEAAGLIGRAWQLASDSGEGQKTAVAAMSRLEWLWLTGQHLEVVEFGTQCLDLAVRIRHRLLRAQTLRHLRRAGRPVVAFAGCPPPYAAGIAGHHVEAAARWQRAGDPYEQALELTECRDRDAVTRGLELLDRLGADAAVARRRLRLGEQGWRGLPRGRQQSTRTHPAQLTRRQAQVLDLVAEGLTNAEIAKKLVLSERTVDNHVSAVLRALGVASRRDAAARARRPGDSQPIHGRNRGGSAAGAG
jgi:DNA-binding CsgD family transcriptional regulator